MIEVKRVMMGDPIISYGERLNFSIFIAASKTDSRLHIQRRKNDEYVGIVQTRRFVFAAMKQTEDNKQYETFYNTLV